MMQRDRITGGAGGSKAEIGYLDRKRIKDVLYKHPDKSSLITSRGLNGKAKEHLTVPSASGKQLDHLATSFSKKKCSDGMELNRILDPYTISLLEVLDNNEARIKAFLELEERNEEPATTCEESDLSGSDVEGASWISWFCSLKGNNFFCEVDDEYIQDDFNLCGLSSQVPYYDYALGLIVDAETFYGDKFTEEKNELIESAAEILYGLIHSRYLLTSKGLAAMFEKYKNYDFGRCPRVYCCGQPCLPVGQSDICRSSAVKIYCPKCEDIYYPRSRQQGNIDGAYFGTTFPHLFFMTYPHLKPQKASQQYIPRVFGFKIQKP